MDSWIPWIASWFPVPPFDRRSREIIITILMKNPIEFRIAFLTYQIRKLFPDNA
jgi:hypothetical protein